MRFIYNTFIAFYILLIKCAAPFNKKAKQWIDGRRNLIHKIEDSLKQETSPIIWIHCSSLGEFEQGRPLLEAIKENYKNYKILLTFFSPSGYEIRKNYPKAEYVFYLPADTRVNAKKFIACIKPKIAIFIKYEYWFNYLHVLDKKNIPVFYVSAIFRKNHYFFKWYGKWALNQLKKINCFFVQNDISKNLLTTHGISHVEVTGDTRFDRVLSLASNPKALPLIELFVQKKQLIIFGSTWPEDDSLILDFIKSRDPNLKFIIVPHEINEPYIHKLIQNSTLRACKYSQLTNLNATDMQLIVVDTVGLLSSMYAYGHIAYIGGGFGKGIHNILEAACFGLPVFFGPNYKKFSEAVALIKLNGAFFINNKSELTMGINTLLKDEKKRIEISEICKSYVINNSGATYRILKKIKYNI